VSGGRVRRLSGVPGRYPSAASAFQAITSNFASSTITVVDREFGHLDTLVGNAGIAIDRQPPAELSVDLLRETYETNVFGVVAVTNELPPLPRKATSGSIWSRVRLVARKFHTAEGTLPW
jgi:NAD(P)-dependent dehydrogenase (short-subunit alcohol dehydrogenase family)